MCVSEGKSGYSLGLLYQRWRWGNPGLPGSDWDVVAWNKVVVLIWRNFGVAIGWDEWLIAWTPHRRDENDGPCVRRGAEEQCEAWDLMAEERLVWKICCTPPSSRYQVWGLRRREHWGCAIL